MLTELRPDLPRRDQPQVVAGVGGIAQRVAELERLLVAQEDRQAKLTDAIEKHFDELNRSGVLKIADAVIDGTPTGSTSPSTGKFTTLEVTTSSVFPSGNFTPGISFGGAAVGITYTFQTGSRIKLGGWELASGVIALSSKGSSTGTARITGLATALRNDNDSYSPVTLRTDSITYTGTLQAYGEKGATTIAFEQVTEAGARSSTTDANFANASIVFFSILYRAT